MPFLVLIFIALAFVQTSWPPPPTWLSTVGSVLTTWAGVAVLVAGAFWLVRCFRRRLGNEPERCWVFVRRFRRWRRLHLLAKVVAFLALLYLAGWGWTVKHLFTFGQWTAPGAELIMLVPFFTSVVLSWAIFYDVDNVVRRLNSVDAEDETIGRWMYVALQARQSLILAAPPCLLLLTQQILIAVCPGIGSSEHLMAVFSGGLLAVVFVGYPQILRFILNLKPLPEGALRERLRQTSQRLSFRCSEILVWNTHNMVATAMVTGPLPFLRYIVLTDRLIKGMEDEEIEAVYAHEIGHVKHRHISFFLVFLMASLITLISLWYWTFGQVDLEALAYAAGQVLPWIDVRQLDWELLIVAPLFMGVGLYVFFVFGLVSRRCERQADLFACRQVSFHAFISALEKVVHLNGMRRDRPGWLASWRHGSIGQRVSFLERIEIQPWIEARFQQETGLLKWGLFLCLALVLLWLGPEKVWLFITQ